MDFVGKAGGSTLLPKVSVIIPVHNGGSTLRNCLVALQSQTYRGPWEIVVVDDGSVDNTLEIVAQFPDARVVSVPHLGPSAARNKGIKETDGSIICLLDADCIPAPNWIEAFVDRFLKDKEKTIGVLHGAIMPPEKSNAYVISDYLIWAHHYRPWQEERDRVSGDTCNMAMRREAAEKTGGFDEGLLGCEDADYCLRAVKSGYRNVFLPRAVVTHDTPRKTLMPLLRKWYRNSLWFRPLWAKHPGELPYSRWFPRSRLLLFALSPAYAAAMTVFTFVANPRDRLKVVSFLPLIFMARLAQVIGCANGASRVRREGRLSYEAPMLKEIIRWNLHGTKSPLPTYLILFVTTRCNARCRSCFYWTQLNSAQELTIEQLQKVSASLTRLGWLHISGGEPFLRDDLADVCHLFYVQNRVRNIVVPTNGLTPERIARLTDEIADRCPEARIAVSVSLDGLEDTHDRIRGVPGSFRKAMETISALTRVRDGKRNLSVNISSVLCNENAGGMPQLLKFVKDSLDVNFHSIGLIRGDPADNSLSLPSAAECRDILDLHQEYVKYYRSNRATLGIVGAQVAPRLYRLLNRLCLEAAFEGKDRIPCYAGKSSCVVEPNGDVRFCELLPAVGNLVETDFDFRQVWFSPEAETQRQEIAVTKCHCSHECFQMRNIMLNPRVWPKLLHRRLIREPRP